MKRELAMGINSVDALIEHSPERLVRAWVRATGPRLEELVRRLEEAGVAVEHCQEKALDRRAGGVRHQGVIVEFTARETLDEHGLDEVVAQAGDEALVLVLDGVTDPNNLGASLRSAAAAGVTAVAVPRDRAAGLTPAARRAAAGAAEIVPLAVVTNLARTLDRLAEQGLRRVGLAGGAGESLYETPLEGPLALVVGSEDKGLRRLTRERCDALVHIPMPGRVESLNVSVAVGIGLFSVLRARNS